MIPEESFIKSPWFTYFMQQERERLWQKDLEEMSKASMLNLTEKIVEEINNEHRRSSKM